MFLNRVLFVGIILTLLFSCSNNPLDVNTTGVSVAIDFVHLDSIFTRSTPSNLLHFHRTKSKQIQEIYEYELGYCLGFRSVADTSFVRSINLFLDDPFIQRTERRIAEKFPSIAIYEDQITEGFKHLKTHFKQGKIPKSVVFMNSLFSSNAFCTEQEIGIGLERYLGEKTDVIRELPSQHFFEWIKEGMDKKFIARDALCSWIMTHYVPEEQGDLAASILRWGKILYLTQAAFPEENPATILRYSEADYAWAIENEQALWDYLVKQKLLFKLDDLNKTNLLNEGPFTPGLPEKGPDRLGQFLGYRIILKYMEENPVSLEKLVKLPYAELLVEYKID